MLMNNSIRPWLTFFSILCFLFLSRVYAEEFNIYTPAVPSALFDLKASAFGEKLGVVNVDINRFKTDEEKVKAIGKAVIQKELVGSPRIKYELNSLKLEDGAWYLFYGWGMEDTAVFGHIFNCKISLKDHSVIYERCR